VALEIARVNRRRLRGMVVAPVLVRCGSVMVLRVIVVSVVVDVQRRGSRGRVYQAKREESNQQPSHWRESMRRELTGQTSAQRLLSEPSRALPAGPGAHAPRR
jgi:hypothetical protein